MATGNIHIGTITGKLNGDAGDHAQRLAHGPVVDVGRDLLGEVTLEQLRNAAGEFDHFDTARHFALGVGEDFAVLAVIIRARVSRCSLSKARNLNRMRARRAGVADQAGNAAAADCTAASTSETLARPPCR
jgi:hypothetical protein